MCYGILCVPVNVLFGDLPEAVCARPVSSSEIAIYEYYYYSED